MGAFDHLEWTYDGAFEQLSGLGREEFEQKFSKNSNARGVARGGMLKLRFDWYIITVRVVMPSFGKKKFRAQFSKILRWLKVCLLFKPYL